MRRTLVVNPADLKLSGHGDHIVLWRIVLVAVGEDEPHVCRKFEMGVVAVTLNLVLHGAEIHGLLDDGEIVLQLHQGCVNRLVKGPCVGRVFFRKKFSNDFIASFQ